jgi:hypothetical protein
MAAVGFGLQKTLTTGGTEEHRGKPAYWDADAAIKSSTFSHLGRLLQRFYALWRDCYCPRRTLYWRYSGSGFSGRCSGRWALK